MKRVMKCEGGCRDGERFTIDDDLEQVTFPTVLPGVGMYFAVYRVERLDGKYYLRATDSLSRCY